MLTTVVGVQALIFQDGGLLALGANIFNMAVIAVFVAHFAYRSAQRLLGGRRWSVPVSGFAAGWLSVFIAALATALELALSGTSPANIAIPAMGGIHALIGIGEGLITAGALAVIAAALSRPAAPGADAGSGSRPSSLGRRPDHRPGAGRCLTAGLCPPGWLGMGRRAERFPGRRTGTGLQGHP